MNLELNCVSHTLASGREGLTLGRTWHTLDEVGHHGAKVSTDVLEDLCVFVILSLQEHAGQIHIFQEQSTQGERVAFQSAVCAAGLNMSQNGFN